MGKYDLVDLYMPLVVGLIIMCCLGLIFFGWKRQADREHYLKLRELNLKEQEIKESSSTGNSIHIENASNQQADLGGYITLDIPEERKSLFHDLLKGC
jgi:hypothetical protein